MTDPLDARVAALLAAPAGCAFLLAVEENGLVPSVAAQPDVSVNLAAVAISELTVWRDDHDRIVATALRHGRRLRPLAAAVLARPETAWWFGPLARDGQEWVAAAGERFDRHALVTGTAPPTSWERYAQKPAWGLYTSSGVAGTSSLLAGAAQHAGDLGAAFQPPLARYRLTASPAARIYEVDGPGAWRRLCLAYAAPEEGGLEGGLTVPDFAAAARDWDAVHLTLGGLLTAEQVRLAGNGHRTELQGWDAEQTVWLRDRFAAIARLPDVLTLPEIPLRSPPVLWHAPD